jgi:hypothetical protein
MQNSRLAIIQIPQEKENISEQHLKIFYKKSYTNTGAQRNHMLKVRILKKISVHTMEQIIFFEEMFSLVYGGYFERLSKSCPALSGQERILIALTKIDLAEKTILQNMGCTIEEIRKIRFAICKKMKIDSFELIQMINTL